MSKTSAGNWSAGDVIAAFVLVLAALLFCWLGTDAFIRAICRFTVWLWNAAGGDSADATQESMARAAWIGIVVGMITIAMLAATLSYTHTSTKISLMSVKQAQLIGQKQVRAYIGAHDVTVKFVNKRDLEAPPDIKIKVSNTGQTPARHVRMRMGWQNWKPIDLLQIDNGEPYSAQEIGAGQTIAQPIPCWDFKGETLWRHLLADAESYIQGRIEYIDVFGEDHFTLFRIRLTGNYDGPEPIIYVEWTQDANLST